MKQRLKSLELHGYKSFVNKIRFEFPSQITAIVGPNGSGKSNIADAVRWVLGEQAYSLLRGKKTTDMIFAGSELRPRASMATTTITFNNEDGWLPIEYTEVSIARRAYRNGENEYFLNNSRVRLKEINELLAKSGLSERTYTIIGQGLVESILSLKPEERRLFFEEAAGIELYRSRRDEAIQKLDKTQRNMERAHDILSELVPRMNSLEKQAERAKQYEQLKADLFILLRDWYGFQWTNLQNELTIAQEGQWEQEKKLNSARDDQKVVENQYSELRAKISQMRQDLANWHQELSHKHVQQEQINRNLAVLEERKLSLFSRKNDLQEQVEILKEEINDSNDKITSVKIELTKTKDEFQKADGVTQAAEKKLKLREKEREGIENQIHDAQQSKKEKEIDLLQHSIKLEELERRNALLNGDLEKLITGSDEDSKSRKVKEDYLNELTKKISKTKEDLGKSFQNLDGSQQKYSEIAERVKKKQDDLSKRNTHLLNLQTQIRVLEEAEQTLSGISSGAKELVNAKRTGEINGNLDLLLANMQVPVEYEVAIASVLGETIEAVVLNEEVDPDAVLDYLHKGESGRTVIVSNKWKASGLRQPLIGKNSAVCARDVVIMPKHIAIVMDSLMSRIFIVKNRAHARKMITQSGGDLVVVTMQGEVFHGNGVVVAGKELRVKNIARTREKNELINEIVHIKEIIGGIDNEVAKENNEIEKINLEIQKESELIKSSQKTLENLESDRSEILFETQKLNQKLNWQTDQIKQIREQLDDCTSETRKLEGEKVSINQVVDEIQKQLKILYEQLENIPLESFKRDVYLANANKKIYEQKESQFEQRMQDIITIQHKQTAELEELRERLDECDMSIEEISKEFEGQKIQKKKIEALIDSLQSKILPTENKLNQYDVKQNKLLQSQDHSRQRFMIAEKHHIQTQMKLSRLREQQENLRGRIEEDLGIVSYEYTEQMEGSNPLPLNGIVENLPSLKDIPEDLEENIQQQKNRLRRMGSINPDAQSEYKDVKERHQFITEQLHDLEKAERDLRQVVSELDGLMKTEFNNTFNKVNNVFKEMFVRLFGGGSAQLIIADEDHLTESGIDIHATLPGKRKQELASLSGGEKSLTAVALIFALLNVSPTPFCILDEVDAMLDETNVVRFGELLLELSEQTQCIVITHNRNTVQLANVLYGVTMGKDTTSQVISLKLDELTEEFTQ